jgi:hypothetical protein
MLASNVVLSKTTRYLFKHGLDDLLALLAGHVMPVTALMTANASVHHQPPMVRSGRNVQMNQVRLLAVTMVGSQRYNGRQSALQG